MDFLRLVFKFSIWSFECSFCEWFIDLHQFNTDNMIAFILYVFFRSVFGERNGCFYDFVFDFHTIANAHRDRPIEWWSLACEVITWHPVEPVNNVQKGTFSSKQIMWFLIYFFVTEKVTSVFALGCLKALVA